MFDRKKKTSLDRVKCRPDDQIGLTMVFLTKPLTLSVISLGPQNKFSPSDNYSTVEP